MITKTRSVLTDSVCVAGSVCSYWCGPGLGVDVLRWGWRARCSHQIAHLMGAALASLTTNSDRLNETRVDGASEVTDETGTVEMTADKSQEGQAACDPG